MPRHFLPLLLLHLLGACASAPPEPVTLRVLSYNVKHGRGMDDVVDVRRAAELVRDLRPDLVVLQEIDERVERSGREDQMRVFAEVTGLEARFGAFMGYQGGHYGMGLLSRFPIVASTNRVLPDGAEPRSALDARVRLPWDQELVLCGVHFYRTEQERLAQARTIVEAYADEEVPVILAGDFNSRPGSSVMRLVEEHWTDAEKGTARFTFPSDAPRLEIDFVLFRPRERFRVLSVDVVDEPLVSDHRPVLAVLELLPAAID